MHRMIRARQSGRTKRLLKSQRRVAAAWGRALTRNVVIVPVQIRRKGNKASRSKERRCRSMVLDFRITRALIALAARKWKRRTLTNRDRMVSSSTLSCHIQTRRLTPLHSLRERKFQQKLNKSIMNLTKMIKSSHLLRHQFLRSLAILTSQWLQQNSLKIIRVIKKLKETIN